MNTKEKLLGLGLKEKEIDIEGTKVIIKEMTAGQGTEYEKSLYNVVGKQVIMTIKDARVKLIQLTCCDETGERLFKDTDIEQVKMLPNRIASILFSAASELNGLTVDGKVDIDESVKN